MIARAALVLALAASVPAQTIDELEAACAVGAFDVAFAIRALDAPEESGEVGRMAAAIVRHEWFELPPALFDGVAGRPRASRRLLEELARGPRPAATDWLRQQARAADGRDADHRLLALAALGEPLDKDGAALLLEALEAPVAGDGYHLALPLLSSKLADAQLGRVHQGLMQGRFPPERLAFFVDRLSARGVQALLGMSVSLDPTPAEVLLRHVAEARPELVRARCAVALDADAPIERVWLPYAHLVLDSDARAQRLVELVRAADSPVIQTLAFEALLSAGRVDDDVLAAALDADADEETYLRRVRSALTRQPGAVSPRWLLDWMRAGGSLQQEAVQATTRRQALEPELQKALLALLDDVEVVTRGVALDALLALTLRGDADVLQRVWPLIVSSPSWSDLLDRLAHREEPFVYERLLAELVDGEPDGVRDERDRQRDVVRLLLVGRGDRRELATIVRHAPQRSAMFLRRCRHHVDRLEVEHARKLFGDAVAADDLDVAAELLEWATRAGAGALDEPLWRLWTDPPATDAAEALTEIAMRVLCTGSRRAELVAQLRAQLGVRPLDDKLSSLPYELLNSMATPPTAEDLRLCAELLLLPACGDPDGERRLAQRWPDGSFGFPLTVAVATRLRGADPVAAEAAFASVVDQLLGDRRAASISRQRLKVFWRSLAAHRELLEPLGCQTARLWGDDAGDGEVAPGAALWFAARQLERDGAFAQASPRYRLAARALLRRPDARHEARWLLGERDPAAGDDPWARLAAAADRMDLLVARAAGDDAAARAAAARVREFAGHDAATLATLTSPRQESDR